MTTIADKQWMDDITRLGCVVCRNLGYGESPAEVHHLRSGVGVGQRSKHQRSIPLCPEHHRNGGHGIAFHAGAAIWQELYGHEIELLEQTVGDVEDYRSRIVGRSA